MEGWIIEAMIELNYSAYHLDVARYIWDKYENTIREWDSDFYQWQYILRWSKQRLSDKGKISTPRKGIWELS